jgi:hypothetical protein
MPVIISIVLVVAVVAAVLYFRSGVATLKRAEYIRTYAFPKGLFRKLAARRPEMDPRQAALVLRGLRQFFLGYLKSGGRYVSMPSQVVDDLWHEFILHTREYAAFCQKAFGGYMHHTPASVLGPDRQTNEGLRRTWWWACKDENINPAKPSRLPLLFALDAKLGIANGFVYAPDCNALRRNGSGSAYCAGDFSSSDVDGSTGGFGDSGAFDSGDGGSDGGDGGDGGGCGGGGD